MSLLKEQSHLFTKQCIQKKVTIAFKDLKQDIERSFMEFAEKNIVNKCSKEGYISNNKISIISYSAGKTKSHYVEYNVIYEFEICFPYEGLQFECIIESITKIGIKAIIDRNEKKNPIVVFASQLHNQSIFESDNEDNNIKYKEGEKINIKVIGHRFEINDPSIYVLGEIIE